MLIVRKELSGIKSPPLYEFVINGPMGLFCKAAAWGRNQRAVLHAELNYLFDIINKLTCVLIIFMLNFCPVLAPRIPRSEIRFRLPASAWLRPGQSQWNWHNRYGYKISSFGRNDKDDPFAKSQKSCHSREGGSPDLFNITGFPPSRE